MVWISGGGLAISMIMILGLLLLVVVQGVTTFWPAPVVRIETASGQVRMGEVTKAETYEPAEEAFYVLPEELREQTRNQVEDSGGKSGRRLVRTGNFELTGTHFHWVSAKVLDRLKDQ